MLVKLNKATLHNSIMWTQIMVSENSRAYCIVCPAGSYGISQSLMAHLNKINNQKQKPKWYSQTTAKNIIWAWTCSHLGNNLFQIFNSAVFRTLVKHLGWMDVSCWPYNLSGETLAGPSTEGPAWGLKFKRVGNGTWLRHSTIVQKESRYT